VEEHEEVGYPNHCAGLITPRTLNLADLQPDSLVQNELKGAVIRSTSGRELSIGGDKIHALAIDRPRLDAKLAQEARQAGARLLLRTRATNFERQGDAVRIRLDNEHQPRVVETRLLIGADGARSSVARWANLPGPREVVRALNARVHLPDNSADFVEVFVGRSLAPGWFAWVIPLGNGEARLGTGTTEGSPTRCLKELIAAFPRRFRNMEIQELSGGLIPLGVPHQICADNVMLVGDAACQVKPTSGGGVYTGLQGARNCARAASQALQDDDLSTQSLKRYHTSWLEQMGAELEFGMLARGVFTRLRDEDFDGLLRLLGSQTMLRIISEYGDMDHPSHLLRPLIAAFPVLSILSSLGVRLANRDEWVKNVIGILRTSR
jgi:geranylgeranyl reductase family protein